MDKGAHFKARWETTLKRAGVQGADQSLFEEILKAYDCAGRYYHVKDHLYHMFKVYDRFFVKPNATLELAFWYHDFVYDPTARDNEVQSANVGQERITSRLRLDPEIGAQVRDLILFSQYKRPPETREEMTLHDVDLSIFGESMDLFEKYEKDIRLEYSFVPEPDYKKGRSAILRRFLRDPFYFTSEMFYSSYEDLAQINIRKSIEALAA